MKKSIVRTFVPGTAAYVFAHGKCQTSKGKGFSLTYDVCKNPREANILAYLILRERLDYLKEETGVLKKIQGSPYKGEYVIELLHNCSLDFLPDSVILEEEKITVLHGEVAQSMGGLYFSYQNGKNSFQEFSIGYKFLKRVLDKDGNILWQNWDYDKAEEIKLLENLTAY